MPHQKHHSLPMGRIQVTGSMLLMCPECYKVRKYRITPMFWRFQCKNEECRSVFYWAPRLLVAGKRKPKLDPADRVFPKFAVEEWQEHQAGVVAECTGD